MPETCSECNKPIPDNAVFCPTCGPPHIPEENPDKGISFGGALRRIFFIVLLFSLIALYKLDVNWDSINIFELSPDADIREKTRAGNIPDDDDFKVVHFVNVPRANVRAEKSGRSKVVTILEKGVRVTLVEKDENWSKIQVDGTTGWIATRLLTAQVE